MPDYKENIGEAVDLKYLQSKIESIGGAENAVPHMTSKQFNLLETPDNWEDYAKYLNDEQIASLTADNLKSMGGKVSDIPDINEINIEGGANSPFLSIDHKQLSETQLQSLDASHIQQLIDNGKMIDLGENVKHLDPDALANAASSANGITPENCIAKLQTEHLTKDQLEALIAKKDTAQLNQIDGVLQAQYVKNEGTAKAASEAAAETAADAATISAGTIIAIVVAAIIVLAMMFEMYREK